MTTLLGSNNSNGVGEICSQTVIKLSSPATSTPPSMSVYGQTVDKLEFNTNHSPMDIEKSNNFKIDELSLQSAMCMDCEDGQILDLTVNNSASVEFGSENLSAKSQPTPATPNGVESSRSPSWPQCMLNASPCDNQRPPVDWTLLLQQHLGGNAADLSSFGLINNPPFWPNNLPLIPPVPSSLYSMLPIHPVVSITSSSNHIQPIDQIKSDPFDLTMSQKSTENPWFPTDTSKHISMLFTNPWLMAQFSEVMSSLNQSQVPVFGTTTSPSHSTGPPATLTQTVNSVHNQFNQQNIDRYNSTGTHPLPGSDAVNTDEPECQDLSLPTNNPQAIAPQPRGSINVFEESSSSRVGEPSQITSSQTFECKEWVKADNDDHLTSEARPPSNPIRKCNSHEQCGFTECRNSALREHYHCKSCNKVMIRREEMIRHAKWHRKRDESLQYGFMRYSPGDNCDMVDCVHNGRQTHYHCLKPNCSKVYISTSDVQMHANFHRKDAVIIQEGFQRFRASENCGVSKCTFHQERTTHFHCRRSNCQFAFKNKADMEKHKLHHQKNDDFAKDGFRKYIKCESCGFYNCQYSGVMNHIHCIRPGCDYVVHSSSQILSHKRKHDRRYSHLNTSMPNESLILFPTSAATTSASSYDNHVYGGARLTTNGSPDAFSYSGSDHAQSPYIQSKISPEPQDLSISASFDFADSAKSVPRHERLLLNNSVTAGNDLFYEVSRLVVRCIQHHSERLSKSGKSCDIELDGHAPVVGFLFDSTDDDIRLKVHSLCQLVQYHNRFCTDDCSKKQPHYHCFWPGCESINSRISCVSWTNHIWQAALFKCGLFQCDQSECAHSESSHLHCYFWPACDFITSKQESKFLVLYTHLIRHDSRLSTQSAEALDYRYTTQKPMNGLVHGPTHSTMTKSNLSILHNPRRRGRPPKYTKHVRVPRPDVPEELCVDNPRILELTHGMFNGPGAPEHSVVCGVKHYASKEICPDSLCDYSNQGIEHYHCVRLRCFMSSNSLDVMNVHRREFHQHVTIEPGFQHFDRSVNCRRPTCHEKKMTQHYHCIRPNCDYAFVRPTTMIQHARKHDQILRRRQISLCHDGTEDGAMLSKYTAPLPSMIAPSRPATLPCLPLGLSPSQIPNFPFPLLKSNEQMMYSDPPFIPTSEQANLPGFLPLWAAAMAAAASTMLPRNSVSGESQETTSSVTNVANGIQSDLIKSPIGVGKIEQPSTITPFHANNDVINISTRLN